METKTIRVNDVWTYRQNIRHQHSHFVNEPIVKVSQIHSEHSDGIYAELVYENGNLITGFYKYHNFVSFHYNDTENTFRPIPESKYMDALVAFTRNPSAENEKKLRWAWYNETGNLVSAR